MSSDKIQQWISKLSQFESELERLHIALSLPQNDPAKHELMRKLADNDVPKAISKIQAKIAELQPPKPPLEAPPRARGRRPHCSFELSLHSARELENLGSQQLLKSDRSQQVLESKNQMPSYGKNRKPPPALFQEKANPVEANSSQLNELQDNLESLYLTGNATSRTFKHPKFGSNQVLLQPGTSLSDRVEWSMINREQGESIDANPNAHYTKTLTSKLDLRDQSSNWEASTSEASDKFNEDQAGKTNNEKEFSEVQGTRSFRKASSDGRIQLSYLADLTQHELYQ